MSEPTLSNKESSIFAEKPQPLISTSEADKRSLIKEVLRGAIQSFDALDYKSPSDQADVNRLLKNLSESVGPAEVKKMLQEIHESGIDTSFIQEIPSINPGLSAEKMREVMNNALKFIKNKPSTDEGIFSSEYAPSDIMEALENLPTELGSRFNGHGVSKVNLEKGITGQLEYVNNVLTGIEPLDMYSAPLHGEDGEYQFTTPYTDGPFVLISHADQKLENGVAGLMIYEPLYAEAHVLQAAYPNVKVIKSNELREALEEMVNGVIIKPN